MQGRTKQQGFLQVGENLISIPQLQSGLYLVNVGGKTYKLLKQ